MASVQAPGLSDLAERTALNASIEPAERIRSLRRLRERATSAHERGQIDSYIGSLHAQQEGAAMARVLERAAALEGVDVRAALSGELTDAELDAAGLPTRGQLREALEDGTLEEAFGMGGFGAALDVGLLRKLALKRRRLHGRFADEFGVPKGPQGRGGKALPGFAKRDLPHPPRPQMPHLPNAIHTPEVRHDISDSGRDIVRRRGEDKPKSARHHRTVGVTPFRPEDDPKGFYESPKFAEFEQAIEELRRAFHIETNEMERNRGVYQGGEEPSVALEVKGRDRKVRGFMAALGKRFDQDAVASFTPSVGGEGARYRMEGIEDIEGARELAEERFGFANIVGNTLEFWDADGEKFDVADEMAEDLGVTLEVTPGHVEFIDRSSYDDTIREAGREGRELADREAGAAGPERGDDGQGRGPPEPEAEAPAAEEVDPPQSPGATFENPAGDPEAEGDELDDLIDEIFAKNPQQEGEEIFAWQARVCNLLPADVKHEVLFRIREKPEPVDFVAEGAARYRAEKGLPDPQIDISTVPASVVKAEAVADAFDGLDDEADRPEVREAFEDFKRQNEEMFEFITRPESEGGLGITVEIGDPDSEAYGSAAEQAADVRENRHFRIQSGLGGEHSLMSTDEYDRFRVVHDVFGHVGIGGGFDRHGEYEAWLAHMSMYTGRGRDAMSSEYHGVNSSMWAGKGTGTGRSVLLDQALIQSPWDENGNLRPDHATMGVDPDVPQSPGVVEPVSMSRNELRKTLHQQYKFSVPASERHARGLGGDEFGQLNRALREKTVTPEVQEQVNALDRLVNHKPLEQPIRVYRGTTLGMELPNVVEGSEFDYDGFIYTSLDNSVPNRFGTGGAIELTVPAGVPAYYIGNENDEMLLGRGLRLRIDSIDERGKVHATVVPRLEPPRSPGALRLEQYDDPEFQATLAKARDEGLDDWPKPGDFARSLLGDAKDTQQLHTVPIPQSPGTKDGGERRGYTPERKQVHDKIVGQSLAASIGGLLGEEHPITQKLENGGTLDDSEKEVVRRTASDARGGAAPRALWMAGGPASGKSSALEAHPELEPANAVQMNPDDIKEQLPEYNAMVEQGETFAASGVHEESSDVSKRLQAEAADLGLDITIDSVGNSGPGKFTSKIEAMADQGYQNDLVYVTIPTDEAIVRSVSRARKNGRWVPEPALRESHAGVSREFGAIAGSPSVSNIHVFDNTTPFGDAPALIGQRTDGGDFDDLDPAAMDAFRAKADELPVTPPDGWSIEPTNVGGHFRVTGPDGEMAVKPSLKDALSHANNPENAIKTERDREISKEAEALVDVGYTGPDLPPLPQSPGTKQTDQVRKLLNGAPTSRDAHSREEGGRRIYTAERRQVHEDIIEQMLSMGADGKPGSGERRTAPQGRKPRVSFTGGGFASGKGGVIGKLRASDGVILDPDKIKALIPEFKELVGQGNPQANLRVYEEAWDISQALAARVRQEGLDVLVDGVGNTSAREALGRAQEYIEAGYDMPDAVYVATSVEAAKRTTRMRMEKAVRLGKTESIRHIPDDILEDVHGDVSRTFPEILDGWVGDLALYDTDKWDPESQSYSDPTLILSKTDGVVTIEDQEAYDRFLAKRRFSKS